MYSKNGRQITPMPSHPQPNLDFTQNANRRMGSFFHDSFTYIAPLPKYAPAQFQPGPVYRGGEAAAIGHQPYNWTDQWTAYQTPRYWQQVNLQVYKGSQSTASFSVAQNAIAMLLAQRSGS